MLSNAEIVDEYFRKPRAEAREREMVERPPHYCHGGMEAKDVIAAFLGDVQLPGIASFWWGNALKYALRWPYKACDTEGQLRDIDKAIECLTELRTIWKERDGR